MVGKIVNILATGIMGFLVLVICTCFSIWLTPQERDWIDFNRFWTIWFWIYVSAFFLFLIWGGYKLGQR